MCFPIQPVKNRHGIVDDMKSRLIGVTKWIKLTVLFVLLVSAIGRAESKAHTRHPHSGSAHRRPTRADTRTNLSYEKTNLNGEEYTQTFAKQNTKIVLDCAVNINFSTSIWLKDGQIVQTILKDNSNNKRVIGHRFLVDASGNLFIDNVRLEDDGKWQCEAEDAFGFVVQGKPIILTVLDPPKKAYLMIDNRILDPGNPFILVKENADLTVSCVVDEGNPKATLSWELTLGSMSLVDVPELPLEVLNLTATVVDQKVGARNDAHMGKVLRAHHNATLTCFVRHIALDQPFNVSVLLNVQYTPSFAISREPGFGFPIREGMPVSLKCDVDSNPKAKPIWQKDDGDPPVPQSPNGFLNFSEIRREHSGWYKCIARHMLGRFSSIGYFLNVHDVEVTQEPDFDVGELSSTGRQMEVSLGGAVQLACPPGTSGCWARVESGTGRLEPIGASQELRLDNVLYQEGGEYRCVAPSKESIKRLEAIRNALSVQVIVTVPRENSRVPAVAGIDGEIVLTSPVRKERVKRSKKQIAEEAAKVISQADKVECIANDRGTSPEKFYTLPNRKRNKEVQKEYESSSLDRRSHKRRGSLELHPPKKPPRTFATVASSHASPTKPSIFDIFRKPEKNPQPKKSNLRRSVSDASSLRSKAFGPVDSNSRTRKRSDSDGEEFIKRINNKKQLSPIIEVAQREDYFATDNKENVKIPEVSSPKEEKRSESVTEQLKNYIEEVDEALYKETGIRITTPPPKKDPEPIIIDLDKAENISGSKRNKLNFGIGKKLKSLTQKKPKANESNRKNENRHVPAANSRNINKPAKVNSQGNKEERKPTGLVAPTIQSAIKDLHSPASHSPVMIHSSQKPVDKPPLTKGKTVNSMVKRLSSDSCSSPPPTRTNVLIMPNMSVQHNNNQPFSYTRGISPDKYRSNEDLPRDTSNITKPVIYAQVVCGNKGLSNEKQTIHTAYNGRRQPQSDSDEGLGGEDSSGFNRKYDAEKSFTRFGDDQFESYQSDTEKLLDDIDKYKAESPILPKYRKPSHVNGFTSYNGIMERGRGDGMDAKRRESLTEADNVLSPENSFPNVSVHNRVDLSARRDLLESRINRRISDKTTPSPEYYPNKTPRNNTYISEKSSKYYRSGSTSPVGYKEKFVSETKTDVFGERHVESRTKKFFGDPNDSSNGTGFKYNELSDNEPKSLEYQISDYRSSPENHRFESSHITNSRSRYRAEKPKLLKDKNMYRSTPEIHNSSHVNRQAHNSYHDSLPRDDKFAMSNSSQRFRSERFLNREESDRRTDRFVDSGIENDFRRDSSENYPPTRPMRTRRDLYNESEDEGFASSLLITNEKHHTENNHLRKSRKDYDSDINSRDEFSRNGRNKYVPRERSIDDGSHFDPRLDKDVDRSVIKATEKKPPKPEKKSGLEKVKSLFTRDKKKEKTSTLQKVKSKPPHARQEVDEERISPNGPSPDYRNRRRLSTPSPPREIPKRSEATHGSWFKSLDRLTKRKSEKSNKNGNATSTEDETATNPTKLSSSTSNLRFFGDTDQESHGDSVRGMKPSKKRPGLRSQSTRDLHNISEEKRKTSNVGRKPDVHHKSLTNITESERDIQGSRTNLKPPMSPTSRYIHDLSNRPDRRRRKRPDISSVESSTEGDSSQQSQRSVVYLHAATVGDIPGPGYLRSGTRAVSREDLTSNGSSFIQPQVKTLSRSFSVLAPWKPRHQREGLDIDYTQYNKGSKSGKYEQKTSRNVSNRNDNSTLKRKAHENRRSNNYQQSLTRKSRSKENLSGLKQSKEEISRGSTSTLYKKKDKMPRENSRYIKDKDERKMTTKSQSVESIARRSRNEDRDVSRSVSMPRDTEKTAGWFKKSKKPSSNQRL